MEGTEHRNGTQGMEHGRKGKHDFTYKMNARHVTLTVRVEAMRLGKAYKVGVHDESERNEGEV